MNRKGIWLGILLLAGVVSSAQAGWLDSLLGGGSESKGSAPAVTELTSTEMAAGLRQALEKGVQIAVDRLGAADGFFGNPQVRIPLPDHLKSVSSGLRAIGQQGVADEFELSMNRAAEAAVPEAQAIFMEAIRNMTLEDAKALLNGPDDAATQYFRKTGEARLFERMLPIVKQSTSRVGVTDSYNALIKSLSFLGGMVDTQSLDLNNYVTNGALDGLFLMIAQEEKRIRENPVERTTDLLKKVFGAADR